MHKMKVKNCNHDSFWQLYRVINFSRFSNLDNGIKYKCDICGTKCTLKWKWYMKMEENIMKKMATYLLWLSPGIVLIFLVATLRLNYLVAIGLVILYHFAAMYYIIYSGRLKIKLRE